MKQTTLKSNVTVLIQTNDKLKAELINQYFSRVGEDLAKKFPESIDEGFSHITRVVPSISDFQIDTDLLSQQLAKIKPEKASGPDDIKAKELTLAGVSLVESLQCMFSNLVEDKTMPRAWKKGKLKVVQKG